MSNQSSPTRTRNLVAALLAGGLIASLSACGVASSTAASPVSEAQTLTTSAGSPLVQCGMAQLTPRVNAGDPVLARGSDFFTQLDQSQQVPPAVQKVYTADIGTLNDTQQHEVLMFLSSLNECPNVSPQLQQSVLAAFDQLTPQPVSDTGSASSSSGSNSDAGVSSEVIRSDNSTYDSAQDESWADGDWNGHPYWFRPTWDHPVTDADDWTQWGADRHDGIIWRWDGHDWQRFGRADNTPAGKPYLPAPIGRGVFRAPADNGRPLNAPNNNAPSNGVPQAPGSTQAPVVTPSSAAPNDVTPQGAVRPRFDNSAPSTTTSTSGSATAAPSSAPDSTSTTNDRTSTRTRTSNSDIGSADSTTTTRDRNSVTPDRTTVQDRSSTSDSGGESGGASARNRGSRQPADDGQTNGQG